jgi:hypothetical protein
MDDEETERILTTLLELGINTFVCLQAEVGGRAWAGALCGLAACRQRVPAGSRGRRRAAWPPG